MDVSSGGLSPLQKIPLSPGYQVPFAENVKQDAGIATKTVGLIAGAQQAEDILAQGIADLICSHSEERDTRAALGDTPIG
jgi:2,4-dienoyl-CoA reductase-like NADH-dependent reductase (Old Yellow Enzyme family)